MDFATLCSGIEAASVAWKPLGWNPVFFSEIDSFACRMLRHHHPQVPNFGDMTLYHEWPKKKIRLLGAGTPCQAFSYSGLREGLDDPRGNLTLTFLGVVKKYRPFWVVWENVPGVLSDRTNAFGQLAAGLAELGYGWAYRVLDAQHFGVPQRRRRVVLVGCLGGWEYSSAALFEPESLQGDTATRKVQRLQDAAGLGRRAASDSLSKTLTARGPCLDPSFQTFVFNYNARAAELERSVSTRNTAALTRSQGVAVAYALQEGVDNTNTKQGPGGCGVAVETAYTLLARNKPQMVAGTNYGVRKLTPTEYERLQGFPDHYTAITNADGPRYKALGNSWAVPVFRWVGERINALDWVAQ